MPRTEGVHTPEHELARRSTWARSCHRFGLVVSDPPCQKPSSCRTPPASQIDDFTVDQPKLLLLQVSRQALNLFLRYSSFVIVNTKLPNENIDVPVSIRMARSGPVSGHTTVTLGSAAAERRVSPHNRQCSPLHAVGRRPRFILCSAANARPEGFVGLMSATFRQGAMLQRNDCRPAIERRASNLAAYSMRRQKRQHTTAEHYGRGRDAAGHGRVHSISS